VLDHGYVPYKASGPAAQRIVDRADPGFSALLTRVRDALDPDRRMNPGRWPGT
jgi:FAD/FMN-containing dehydrogenase